MQAVERGTRRLLLRQWRDADREHFAAMNADPEVMRYFPGVLDSAASDALLDRLRSAIEERGWGLWAVERRDTGDLVGFAGLSVPPDPLPFLPCVEVGWRLVRPAWGHGFATEAAREALRVGFGEVGLDEVVSFTSEGNGRSRSVMERLGMSHDPADDFERPPLMEGAPARPHVLYRLRSEEWQTPQGLPGGGPGR